MESLKTTLTALFFLLIFGSSFGQAEKTLVKSFNLKGKEVIVLDLDGDVDVQHWKNSTVRIQISVALSEGNETMLKSLVTAGRYNLKSKIGDQDFEIFAPGLRKEVSIKGKPLKEAVTFIVYAPEDAIIKMSDSASTSLDKGIDTSL